ncbi:MAG TPA: tetratricopeptide repeat protein [Pyrinomonadaceae bacterium]|nr:tetratricopeptide repeat protein [Pyrinomonadaceae bacterium]
MGENQKYFFEFDEYRLDPIEQRLTRAGKVVPLKPKAFETLSLLVENAGHLLAKDRLMEMLWADAFVEEGNLADNISKIRQALGDSRKTPKFIETVSGRGYRFVARVERVEAGDVQVPPGAPGSSTAVETEERPVSPEESPGHISADGIRAGVNAAQPIATPMPDTAPRPWRGRSLIVALTVLGALGLLFYIWYSGPPQPSGTPAGAQSIAVLPFKPLVAANRDEALELGMSDTLISGLSRLRQIVVRPISSVRRYSDLEQDARAAGRELAVESVLDGNIQRTDDRIRISARLVRVEDGTTLWAETFDERFTDIFSVQDSIAQKIVAALALQLSGEERNQLTKKYTANTEAYHLYLKGRFFWNKLTPDGLQKSLDFYKQAIETDPDYALAYAGLADSYNLLGSYGFWPLKDSHPKARAAAEKALAYDDALAEAHTSLAAVLDDYYWDWTAAEKHFKRAIELNPNYLVARYWYSEHLSRMGQHDEAVDEARRAQSLDPLSSNADAHVGLALYRARHFDEAAAELQKALEFNPNALDAHLFLGFVYVQQGKKQEGIAELQAVAKLSDQNPSMRALLGYAYASAGNTNAARAILREFDSQTNKQPVSQVETAMIYIALGENDRAFEWLDKAFEQRAWQLRFLKVEPIFDPLRGDPRFADLMRRVGLVP